MSSPFSLRIFVADGDPDGLRVVERSNWIGKALIFPRALLPKVKQRDELSQTGVYLLLGPRDDGEGEKLYIGEGDPIRPRLDSHYAQKDFWTRAVGGHARSRGARLRATHGDVPARHRPVAETRRFQCAMKASVVAGVALLAPLANGARMPSTAEEVCAETRNAALRAAADLRCGLDCLSVTLPMVVPQWSQELLDATA